jgi:glycerol-3-phosphate acyltransferase PlsY
MNPITALFVGLAGYLLGAISFARLVASWVNPAVNLDQARTHQSATGELGPVSGIGAATASMALGSKYGFIVSLLDMLKALIPVLMLRLLYPADAYYLLFSLFAIIGHNWPVYSRFQGGRGLSVMLGSLLVIEPVGTVIAMLAGTLLSVLINRPPTALLLWFPLLTLWSWWVRNDIFLIVYSLCLPILFLLAEIPDIQLALQYQKQGRIEEYNQMILNSSSQMRGMKRLAQRIRFWEKNP